MKRNSKCKNTLRNSNCNSNVQTFEISENLWMLDETPHRTSPTWKIHTFAWKHVGWNFVQEQTSSNIIQHDFFLLFQNFINFVIGKPLKHFTQHGKNILLDEMLDWFASALSVITVKTSTLLSFNSKLLSTPWTWLTDGAG